MASEQCVGALHSAVARTFVVKSNPTWFQRHEVRPKDQGMLQDAFRKHRIYLLTLCAQTDIYTEWRDYYLDYNGLKKVLKEGTLYSTWNAQREKQFLELLESELEKIQGFQQSKVCNEFMLRHAPQTDWRITGIGACSAYQRSRKRSKTPRR